MGRKEEHIERERFKRLVTLWEERGLEQITEWLCLNLPAEPRMSPVWVAEWYGEYKYTFINFYEPAEIDESFEFGLLIDFTTLRANYQWRSPYLKEASLETKMFMRDAIAAYVSRVNDFLLEMYESDQFSAIGTREM